MKKILLALCMLSMVACSNDELVTKEYTIQSVSNGEYNGIADDKTGIAFEESEINEPIKIGDTVKVTFTKEQYESMEGLEKVELVK